MQPKLKQEKWKVLIMIHLLNLHLDVPQVKLAWIGNGTAAHTDYRIKAKLE